MAFYQKPGRLFRTCIGNPRKSRSLAHVSSSLQCLFRAAFAHPKDRQVPLPIPVQKSRWSFSTQHGYTYVTSQHRFTASLKYTRLLFTFVPPNDTSIDVDPKNVIPTGERDSSIPSAAAAAVLCSSRYMIRVCSLEYCNSELIIVAFLMITKAPREPLNPAVQYLIVYVR